MIGDGSENSNVSFRERSEYLRPFERYAAQPGYKGCTWKMAHYLQPIMVKQLQLTASTPGDVSTSVIYQNPYWPVTADQPAEK